MDSYALEMLGEDRQRELLQDAEVEPRGRRLRPEARVRQVAGVPGVEQRPGRLMTRKLQDAIRGGQRLPRGAWVVAALPVLWLTQGSTFIALKIGIASVPPFLLSAARFLVVGVLLLGWSAFRSGWRLKVDRQEALLGAVTGVGMILVGQGSASWSSQYLAPGVVAILTSTIPLWAALIGLLAFRTRLGGMLGSFGLVAGFAGVAFLAWPANGSSIALGPALVVAGGAAGWGAAVVVLSRSGKLRRPLLVTALQALIGGGLQLVVGLAAGEPAHLVPQDLVPAIPAFVYLVVVASLIGYPLLMWLLSEVPVHVANTGSYVAPVIALGLGWLLLAEPVTPRTVGGVGVILAGVAVVVRSNRGAEAEPRVAAGIGERAA
jgi:drug/metabolite transporter (DMT)-like permease